MARLCRLFLLTSVCLVVGLTLPTFTTCVAAVPAPWLDSAWPKRVRLTAKTQFLPASGSLQDFDLVLTLDGDSLSSVFDLAQSDGSDFQLTASDGLTVLDHEIAAYDSTTHRAEIWFRAPTLSSTDRTFYLYYGNSGSMSGGGAVSPFGPENLLVYHFEGDPAAGILHDSGPHGNSGVAGAGAGWTSDDLQPGQIGSGWDFDGVQNWAYTEISDSPDSSFTVSAWASQPAGPSSGSMSMQSLAGYWNLSFRRRGGDPSPALETNDGFITWDSAVTDTTMHHFVWMVDGVADTARFYLDGVAQPILVEYSTNPPKKPYTGETIGTRVGIAGPAYFNALDLFTGRLDEFRISEGLRSDDWIATQYQNQSQGAAFFTYEIESSPLVTGVDPILPRGAGHISVWPNPFSFSAQISVEGASAGLSVAIYDLKGRRVRSLDAGAEDPQSLRLTWDGRDATGAPVASGIYYVRAVGRNVDLSRKVMLVR